MKHRDVPRETWLGWAAHSKSLYYSNEYSRRRLDLACGAGALARAGLDGLDDEILGEIFWMKFRGGDGGRTIPSAKSKTPFLRFRPPQHPSIVPSIPDQFQKIPKTSKICLPVPQAFTQPPNIQGFLLNLHILSILHRCPTYPPENVVFTFIIELIN